MEWKEALRVAIQEWVIPEFDKLRLENAELRSTLQQTNRRLDDMQLQLVDLSRRIDETNRRIDGVREELLGRIDGVREELLGRIDETNRRIDETNKRIDRLYEVIVRRDEHVGLERWVRELDRKVLNLEHRLAA